MNVIARVNLPATESLSTNVGDKTGRLTSAAKEFESALLGQWLKDAESTFGSVSGSEEDDPGGEQMKEFTMHHLASEITNRGGIGIAPIVEKALMKQEASNVTFREGDGR
jgi:Rod binding domain-containing protein